MKYQKQLDSIIEQLNNRPKLLIHSCCAPCSSYVIEYLRQYFNITILYYNPNITQEEEYRQRLEEQGRLIGIFNRQDEGLGAVNFMEGSYEPEVFFHAIKGLEKMKEGGERCHKCFELRLDYTAKKAKELCFDYFTTTLTISPMKNADLLNEIGNKMAKEYGVSFLPSDFKKKNGYKRSVELSSMNELYRQDYCGCVYSKLQREDEKNQQSGLTIK